MKNVNEHKKNFRQAANEETKGTKSFQKRKLEEQEQLEVIKAFNAEWDNKNNAEE